MRIFGQDKGGELTLMGLDSCRRLVKPVEQDKRQDQTVTYTIQTNGTRPDDEGCAFLKEHNCLIGMSVDGPPEINSLYLVDKGSHLVHIR